MATKKIAIVSITSLSLLLILLALNGLRESSPIAAPAAVKEIPLDKTSDYKAIAITGIESTTEMTKQQQLKSYFNDRFDNKLSNPYWQLKILESMIQLFKQLYPDNWQEEIMKFIRAQYPELADVLLMKFNALNEYMDWMANLEHSMDFTSDADRIRAMWDKRVALFGDEAYVIWEAAYKDQQFDESIKTLENSYAPFEQKIEEYKAIFSAVHNVDVSSDQQKHKTQIMTRFLNLANVQSDLKVLPAEERRSQLRAFRESMGLDEPALNRWEKLDTERDQQRAASEIYLTEQRNLKAALSGAALEQAITNLQNKLFGENEAGFIRNEEASGFFRFEAEQQYGVN